MSGAAPSGSAPARAEELELPRSVRRVWIPAGCVLLTLFFFVQGFPWERVGEMASARISALTGTRIAMRSLSPAFGLLPGVAAEGVTATLASGDVIQLDAARVRPALSPSWLRGRPALAIDVRGPLGSAEGTAYLGPEPGFTGRLEGIDLAKLPVASLGPGAALDGRADADADVRVQGPAGARGTLTIDARSGSLSLPGLPIALPFETIHAEVELTDAALLQIGAFDLDGPLLAAKVSGSVGRAPFLAGAPLQLEVRLDAKDASVRPLLGQAGLRVGPDGAAQVRVLGTVAQPLVR